MKSLSNAQPQLGLKSEYPRPLLRPTLHDHLLVGEEFEGVAALAVEVAIKTVARAAEGERGDGRGHADIDADVANFGFTRNLRALAPLDVKRHA